MKTHIDFFTTFKGEFLAMKRFLSRFIRYWGTETIDGVEVLKKRFYIYPNTLTDPNIKKMSKLLGSWNQIKNTDFSAVKSYYLWLNPSKGETVELSAEILAGKVDTYCPLGEWKYVTIKYIDRTDPTKFNGFTAEQILSYIDNDYRRIFDYDNGFVIGDTILETTIGKYVLFDDGTEFEVEAINTEVTSITPSVTDRKYYGGARFTGLSIDFKFRRIAENIDPNGIFIQAFLEEQTEYNKKLIKSLQNSTGIVTNGEDGGGFYETTKVTNDIWYKSQLRYSVVTNSQIKTKDRIRFILSSIDTGQVSKSVPWWKKLLGLVLITIAIVVAVATAGAGAPLSTVLTSIALYVGIAVLIMVAVQYEWSKNDVAAAEYMGRWVKIGNIISMLTGLNAVITNMGTALTEEAARESATQAIASSSGATIAEATAITASLNSAEIAAMNTAMNVTSEITMSTVMTVTKNMVLNAIGTTWKSVSMNIAKIAVSMRQRDMNSQLRDKTKQAKELQAELDAEADKSMAIGIEDLQRYTDNMDRIWTRYDYDAIYGPTPSVIHIGNIQKASSYKGTGLNLRAEDLV